MSQIFICSGKGGCARENDMCSESGGVCLVTRERPVSEGGESVARAVRVVTVRLWEFRLRRVF